MFSVRLKKLRTNKKISQQEMANYLGITRQGYAKYENNDSEPSYEILKKISLFFNVTTDYLLGQSDNPRMTADEEFQAFSNNPKLEHFFREIEASVEQEQEELQQIWEIIKQRQRNKDK
ncbi:helix-turn-helix transcriptional regulator [Mammaliicoccus sciuri]